MHFSQGISLYIYTICSILDDELNAAALKHMSAEEATSVISEELSLLATKLMNISEKIADMSRCHERDMARTEIDGATKAIKGKYTRG